MTTYVGLPGFYLAFVAVSTLALLLVQIEVLNLPLAENPWLLYVIVGFSFLVSLAITLWVDRRLAIYGRSP